MSFPTVVSKHKLPAVGKDVNGLRNLNCYLSVSVVHVLTCHSSYAH